MFYGREFMCPDILYDHIAFPSVVPVSQARSMLIFHNLPFPSDFFVIKPIIFTRVT
jgi:hypothetical protein